jgi:tetratricopeptide (TPR) repeat protein
MCAWLVAAVMSATAVRAGETIRYEAAPAWIKAPPALNVAKLTDTDPVLQVRDQQVRLNGDEAWTYTDLASRAATAQMLGDIGNLRLAWSPDTGDLIVHSLEILRGGEVIDVLKDGQKFEVIRREQRLEQRWVDGMLTATLSVQGLRVGDVLRLRFSNTNKDGALGGGVQAAVGLPAEPAKIGYSRTRMIWPKDQKIAWQSYADGFTAKVVPNGDWNELEWMGILPKPADLPEDVPVRFRKLPILEATSFTDWQGISRTMGALYRTDGLIAANSPLAAEVARIRAAESDPLKRAALALIAVQDQVSYLFNGMNGGNYRPQTPADTWRLRYGDCKAKSLLLLAMLHALEIKAEPVLVHSQLGGLLPGRLPIPAAFDHVIVRADIGGTSYWLDGTSAGAQLADIADVPPFRHALPLRIEGADLMAIDSRPPARPQFVAEIEHDLSAGIDLPGTYTARMTLRGPLVEQLKVGQAQGNADAVERMAQSINQSVVGENATMTGHQVAFDPAQGTATVTMNGVARGGWTRDGERRVLTVDKSIASVAFAPDRSRTAWRNLPVATGDAEHLVSRQRVKLPGNGRDFQLEGDIQLPPMLAGRMLSRRAAIGADGWLVVEDEIKSTGGEIAVADIAATRQEMARAKSRSLKLIAPASTPPQWQQVQAARRANAFAPALAAYAAAIKAKPDDRQPLTNRADFYATLMDWKAVMADLNRAIAIETDADLLLWRARVHQLMKDDKQALVDIQAARALDPGSVTAVSALTMLQMKIGQGDAALDLLDERIAEGGDDKASYLSHKAEVLAEMGEMDMALAAMDEALAAAPGDPDMLNSRCWLKGTRNVALDTALKDCTKSIELNDYPASALDSRAMVYFRMDRMDDAMADLKAALDLAPDMPASLYLRGVIRRRQGNQAEGDADLAAARMLSPRIDEDYARYGIKP